MSVRWSENSDVYIYGGGDAQGNDTMVCCSCKLNDESDFVVYTAILMTEHLKLHRKVGHKVPEEAFEEVSRLEEEEEERKEP